MDTFYKITFSLAFLALAPLSVHAASLNFSPPSGSYDIGSTFSVNVNVESSDQAMNAASGDVSFPQNKLEVVSISKQDSIFSLWPAEPSFSNSQGTVSFEGIVLNPGYQGASGKVITITFKANRAGSAPLTFSSGSVLANDGTGANILDGMNSAQFTIQSSPTETTQPQQQRSPIPSVRIAGTPDAPKIVSPTHSNSERWYSKSTARFSWDVPDGVTAVRLLYGTIENIVPTIYYDSPIAEKMIEDVPNGTYWFHARFKNAAGWGKTAHFKFNVDTVPPERLVVREKTTGAVIEVVTAAARQADLSIRERYADFVLEAHDSLSGIDYFSVQVDDKEPEILRGKEVAEYRVGPLHGGEHTLAVAAVDKAGNELQKSIVFTVEGYSLEWVSALSEWGLWKVVGIAVALILVAAFAISSAIRRLLIALVRFPLRFLVRRVCNICRIGKRRGRKK